MTDLTSRPVRATPDLGRWPSAALVGAPIALIAMLGYRQRWINEDGLTLARVAENLAAGRGPVVNAGERIEATTAPLWTTVVALGRLVTRLDGSTVAVLVGLVLGVAGLVAATCASWRLHVAESTRLRLPVGLLVLLAVATVPAYLTSGMQSGLVMLWLGGSYLMLVASTRSRRRWWPTPLVLGLGPLCDPVLGVVAAAFMLVWAGGESGRDRRARGIALALVPVLVYEVFRAGYYAALVPAPWIARQTDGGSRRNALDYLWQTVGGHGLWIAAILIAVVVWRTCPHLWRDPLVRAPVAAGLVLGVGQLVLGVTAFADRALLTAVITALLPFMVLPWPAPALGAGAARAMSLGTGALLLWCGAVVTDVTAGFGQGPPDFPQERVQAILAGQFPPGSLSRSDLGAMVAAGDAAALQADAEAGEAYFREGHLGPRHAVPEGRGVGTYQGGTGLTGYLAPSVWMVDDVGVLDPVAARLSFPDDTPALIGNRRLTEPAWVLAAHTVPDPGESPAVTQARVVLACGDVADLRAAVRQPLTPGRFLRNLAGSWRFTTLDVPVDPIAAREALC